MPCIKKKICASESYRISTSAVTPGILNSNVLSTPFHRVRFQLTKSASVDSVSWLREKVPETISGQVQRLPDETKKELPYFLHGPGTSPSDPR